MYLILFFVITINGFAQNEMLGLESAREIALQNSNIIKAAAYNMNVASSNTMMAKSGYMPTLDLSAGYLYLGDPISFSGNEVAGGLQSIYSVGMNLNQNIFSGNRVRNNVLIQQELQRLASAQQDLTIAEILYRTDLYYWNALAMSEMAKVAGLFDSVVNRFYADINDRVTDGIAASNDLLQGKVRVNESALNLLQSNNAVTVSKMELNNAMGREPNIFFTIPDSILFYAHNSMQYSDTLLIDSVALSNRAEIDMRESALQASMLNEKIARADYFPTLGLSLSGRYGVPGSLPEYNSPDFNWMGSVYLRYPIFQGNLRRSRVDASQFNSLISNEQLEQQKKDVLLEVNKAEFAFQESIQKVQLTQNSLSQAKLNLDAINEKYTEGLSPLAEVLDAQIFWLNAYTAYVQAKLENKVSLAAFEKALGVY